jgi:hypothetical protein
VKLNPVARRESAGSPPATKGEKNMGIEITSLRRPEDDVEARVADMLLRYEVGRRRAGVVISVGRDSNGKLTLNVERGNDTLREALKHPRMIKADVVARVTAERPPISKVG